MIKKPAIPHYSSTDKTLTQAMTAMKENIEIITGVRPGTTQIAQLQTTATNAEIVAKINEIVAVINFSGQ